MHYCGNCGTELDGREFTGGPCPTCGARITAEGNVLRAAPTQGSAPTWPTAEDDGLATASRGSLRPPARAPRQSFILLFMGIGIVALVALVFVIGLIFSNMPPNLSTVSSTPINTGPATATPAHRTTPHATRTPTGRPTATATVAATGIPTATPSPTDTPSPTPTATPVPPTLVVSTSQLTVSIIDCLKPRGGTASFTIGNSGTGTLTWTLTSNSSYGFNPASSYVQAGAPKTVQVMNIKAAGQITVSAQAGAANSPVSINVTCAPL